MARGLPQDRYQHAIICEKAGKGLPSLLRAEGVEIFEIGLAPHILSIPWHNRAHAIARKYKPEIVHGAVFEGVALANVIGLRMPGVPVISEETSDPANRSWRGNLLMRAMCLRSQAVIGVSPSVGTYLLDKARIPPSKVKIINNACPPPAVMSASDTATLRSSLGFRADNQVIGSVGRVLDSHKRFSDLIRAFAMLRLTNDRARLMIVGDGPDLDDVRQQVNQLGLGDAVVFTGYRSDAAQLMQVMDVFALASAREAFGLVLVEAMLAGVPVVATAVGGIPSVLNHGDAGRLVPAMAPERMAGVIRELLDDDAERQSLAARGKQHAEKEFSVDRYCSEIDALYQSVLR